MKHIRSQTTLILILISFLGCRTAIGQKQSGSRQGGQIWTAEEYSGSRSKKDLRTAFASKGFAWLSGSPADNEKLSIGKNSQFFGFVALRYDSGRAANRGRLGRAFFEIADSDQRRLLAKAVLAEENALKVWWETRKVLLRQYENYLYTGISPDERTAAEVGAKFSKLGALVAITEAQAFAALEDSLTEAQHAHLKTWREDPEKADPFGRKSRVSLNGLGHDQDKQLENLFAKAFSWITGTSEDNEIIPLGQPAQFFGFTSIRHKSGHAASRGRIANSFLDILDPMQIAVIDSAIEAQMPVVRNFMEKRRTFLERLALLRTQPEEFNLEPAVKTAVVMGALEIKAGWIEASAYRKIRETMSDKQTFQMMQLRGDYIVDQTQVESLTFDQRGAQLAILCAGCHGEPGQHRPNMVGPTLDGMFDRPIGSAADFDFSDSLKESGAGGSWNPENLDAFLRAPKAYAPGTKMEFQGLLNAEDRNALIQHLQQTR